MDFPVPWRLKDFGFALYTLPSPHICPEYFRLLPSRLLQLFERVRQLTEGLRNHTWCACRLVLMRGIMIANSLERFSIYPWFALNHLERFSVYPWFALNHLELFSDCPVIRNESLGTFQRLPCDSHWITSNVLAYVRWFALNHLERFSVCPVIRTESLGTF
jgi:hypothetical protein